jgi:hypothetical protein
VRRQLSGLEAVPARVQDGEQRSDEACDADDERKGRPERWARERVDRRRGEHECERQPLPLFDEADHHERGACESGAAL